MDFRFKGKNFDNACPFSVKFLHFIVSIFEGGLTNKRRTVANVRRCASKAWKQVYFWPFHLLQYNGSLLLHEETCRTA